MEQIADFLKSWSQPTGILLALVILMLLNSWIFKRIKSFQSDGNIARTIIAFLLILAGALAFILALPIDKALKGHLLSFFGIVISAGIALSSTTVLGNIIAGIMNDSMKRFRNGDLIKIGDLQGRVTKKSVFYTEVQLEDSNFITIPNLYIATNPVKLTRKANSVVSTSVSLGYDVSRITIEEALKEAALATGLTNPYVYITNLGDFSVEYKIHGFLEDSSKFFSTGSLLNGKVMDTLHEKGIEIVSPAFMNQRRVDDIQYLPKFIAETQTSEVGSSPEELIFDEAIKSEEIEKKRDLLNDIEIKQKLLKEKLKDLKEEDEIERVKSSISRIDDIREKIEQNIREKTKPEKETR